MYSAPRRRGRRTEEKIGCAGFVSQCRGSHQEAAYRHVSAADIAAEQVRIHPSSVAGDETRGAPESSRESRVQSAQFALQGELSYRRWTHWVRGSRPRMCAALAERAWDQKAMAAPQAQMGRSGCCPLVTAFSAFGNLFKRSAKVNGDRTQALWRAPRHRLG